MATTLSRLQLAQRIHQRLLQEIDHAIEVERLLAEPRYARDVLLVCEAIPGGELAALAALFRESGQPPHPGRTPQPNDWSRDTSGFGVSQPPPMTPPPGPPGASRRASDSEPTPLDSKPPRRSWLPPWRDSGK